MLRFGLFAPFRVRSYRFQWPADLLTSWAFEMETLILGWYILVETGSVVMLTAFGALLYGGTLIAPMMGVWSDRIGHRAMLTAMRVSYTLGAAIIALLAITGTLRPDIVLVLAAINGLVRPSDLGLRGTMIAETMPPAILTAAMGISRSTTDTARICGALTGASMFAGIGIDAAYVAISIFYFLGAILTWHAVLPGLAVSGPARPEAVSNSLKKSSPWQEMREGVVLIWNTPRLQAIVCYALLFNFSIFPLTNGLLPYVAKDVYGVDQTGLGYLVAAVAAGALIGSIAMTRSGMQIALSRLMIVAAIVWHVLALVFVQMQTFAAGMLMLVLCGLGQSITMVSHTVILLNASDPQFRGRIMGVRMLAIYTLPLGLLASGMLIGLIGFRATASLYTAIGLALTALIAVHWRASLWQSQATAKAV